jgi:hypothetical protein
MDGPGEGDVCQTTGVWPVRLVVGGMSGWTLWCSGDTDVLLACGGHVPLVDGPEAILAALTSSDLAFTPSTVTDLHVGLLSMILAAPAAIVDLDIAADWFSRPDRPATIEDCDNALSAINMADDIGATVGDDRIVALVRSDALSDVLDSMTFGLTLLGEGSQYHQNPAAMTRVITPQAAAAVALLVQLATGHINVVKHGQPGAL